MRLSDVPLMFHSKCPQSDPSDLKRMAGAIWFTAAKTFLQTRTVCCKSIFCGCPRRLGWCHWRLATPDKTFIRFLFEHVRFSKVSVDSLKSGMCKETLYSRVPNNRVVRIKREWGKIGKCMKSCRCLIIVYQGKSRKSRFCLKKAKNANF